MATGGVRCLCPWTTVSIEHRVKANLTHSKPFRPYSAGTIGVSTEIRRGFQPFTRERSYALTCYPRFPAAYAGGTWSHPGSIPFPKYVHSSKFSHLFVLAILCHRITAAWSIRGLSWCNQFIAFRETDGEHPSLDQSPPHYEEALHMVTVLFYLAFGHPGEAWSGVGNDHAAPRRKLPIPCCHPVPPPYLLALGYSENLPPLQIPHPCGRTPAPKPLCRVTSPGSGCRFLTNFSRRIQSSFADSSPGPPLAPRQFAKVHMAH